MNKQLSVVRTWNDRKKKTSDSARKKMDSMQKKYLLVFRCLISTYALVRRKRKYCEKVHLAKHMVHILYLAVAKVHIKTLLSVSFRLTSLKIGVQGPERHTSTYHPVVESKNIYRIKILPLIEQREVA